MYHECYMPTGSEVFLLRAKTSKLTYLVFDFRRRVIHEVWLLTKSKQVYMFVLASLFIQEICGDKELMST